MILALALLTAAIWLVLLIGRGGFWRCRETDRDWPADHPGPLPGIVAIVPARNEEEVIDRSIGALLAQDYRGPFRIVLVDDDSSDATAKRARARAEALGKAHSLSILTNRALPAGWTGKLHAMARGVAEIGAEANAPEFLLFCDADIALAPDTLSRLVGCARRDGRVMVSLMAKLSVQSWPEKLMIPAFIYFFAKLYPFAFVGDPRRRIAAAAGGCMLVDRARLERAGGLEAIRHEIIDDCALGRLMKTQGPITLALTDRAISLRTYRDYGPIRRMITRSAFAELRYSPLRLLAALAGLAATYLAPPLIALLAEGPAQVIGALVTLAMWLSFVPVLRFYGLSPFLALTLPVIAVLYGAHTFESALLHWQGRGGAWKGRYQARATTGRQL